MDFVLEKAKKNVKEKSKLENLSGLSIEEFTQFHDDMDYIAKHMEKKEILKFLDSLGK